MVRTITTGRIPEEIVPGMRLGRHVRHDSESLRYLVTAAPQQALQTVLWARDIGILDQGDLGSCTGNAATGAIGTAPLFDHLPTGHVTLDEAEAVKLYSAATALDDAPGTYPPDDTGSDGLSVAKAAKAAGLISGYTHATSLAAAQTALQSGPVILGMNWYSSFDSPASDGTIAISRNAYVRGGHEVEIIGLDMTAQTVRIANSWGTSWGDNGFCQMSFATLTRLLAEQGDVTSLLPLNQPAPVPTPVPTPTPAPVPVDDVDTTFADQLHSWLGGHPFFYRAIQSDAKAWLTARGL